MQVFFILFSVHFAVYQYINSKCLYRTHVTIDPRPTRDRPAIIRGHAILAEKMFVNYVSTAILSYCLRFGTKLEHN